MRDAIFIALTLLTAGCSHQAITNTTQSERAPSADSDTSHSPPSISSAQTILAGLIQTESDDRMKLIGFKKSDGQSKTVDGIDVYRFEFEAVMEAQDECWWKLGQIHTMAIYYQRDGAWWRGGTNLSQARSTYNPGGDADLNHLRKGEKLTINGSLTLERKESGWHARAQVCEPPVTFRRGS
jgi:hypothetical protein